MQQREFLKLEIWLDNQYYDKIDADINGYNIAVLLKGFKEKMSIGLIPYADKIEFRKAL